MLNKNFFNKTNFIKCNFLVWSGELKKYRYKKMTEYKNVTLGELKGVRLMEVGREDIVDE